MPCILAFVAGVGLALGFETLPTPPTTALIAAGGAGALLIRRVRWVGALMLGMAYLVCFAGHRLDLRLPDELAGTDLRITGKVVSLPSRDDRIVRFHFSLDGGEAWARTTVALSAYDEHFQPRVGERWALTVRLERPRGSVNPGLFDYDGWMLGEGISARGYVRSEPPPGQLSAAGSISVDALRDRLWRLIDRLPLDADIRGLLVALTIGESAEIGSVNWAALSATGTNHLLIISGLHVGLVVGGTFQLLRLLGMAVPGAGISALIVATGYGLIAGLGLPVQRALVMAAVALTGVLLNRRIPPFTLFCLALLAVTLVNPLALLGAGFWLSFGAVFSLLAAFAVIVPGDSRGLAGWFLDGLKSQWVAFAGTLPLLAWLVAQVSLTSLVANAVAIPWVSVLVIPVVLLGVVCSLFNERAAAAVFTLAGYGLDAIWRFIAELADMQAIMRFEDVHAFWVAVAFAGSCLLLAPGAPLPRWPALLLWLPVFAPIASGPARDEMIVHVIDVGQGLSVLVRTVDHALLYDAGPRYGDRFDSGERIVVPALRRIGYRHRIDSFIVSHSDIDHAGGEAAVRAAVLPVRYVPPDGCRAARWQAGATTVRLMPLDDGGSDNDRSCVVLVSHRGQTVLLPGDIERAGEQRLVAHDLPPVDVMLVPHHGSDSSSTPMLLNRLQPGLAIVSSGYRNRFGHPAPGVLNRYRLRGIPVYDTATSGAITVRLRPDRPPVIEQARLSARRFWYD